MEPEFSPHLIHFGAEPSGESAAPSSAQTSPQASSKSKDDSTKSNANSEHDQASTAFLAQLKAREKRLKGRLSQVAPGSPWEVLYAPQLALLKSEQRCEQLQHVFQPVYLALEAFKELSGPQQLEAFQAEIQVLRQQLPGRYLAELNEDFQALRQLARALLMRLDALNSQNATAFAKAAEFFEQSYQALSALKSGVLPRELAELLKLNQLLERCGDVLLKKSASEAAWTALRQWDADRESVPLKCSAPALNFENGHWLNQWGVAIDSHVRDYNHWMRAGIRSVQQAMKQNFSQTQPLMRAVGHFYAALSVEPERAEAPLALAWLMVLCEQPLLALDYLEYALKLDALNEIQDLFVILRQQLVVKGSSEA